VTANLILSALNTIRYDTIEESLTWSWVD